MSPTIIHNILGKSDRKGVINLLERFKKKVLRNQVRFDNIIPLTGYILSIAPSLLPVLYCFVNKKFIKTAKDKKHV